MQKATDKTEIIGIQFGNKHSLKKKKQQQKLTTVTIEVTKGLVDFLLAWNLHIKFGYISETTTFYL